MRIQRDSYSETLKGGREERDEDNKRGPLEDREGLPSLDHCVFRNMAPQLNLFLEVSEMIDDSRDSPSYKETRNGLVWEPFLWNNTTKRERIAYTIADHEYLEAHENPEDNPANKCRRNPRYHNEKLSSYRFFLQQRRLRQISLH